MVEMIVCSTSDWRGKSLQEVRKGQDFKFLIPIIDRNGKRIFAPRGDEIILANDRLFVLGEEEGLIKLHQQFEDPTRLISAQDIFDELNLEIVEVGEDSPLQNKRLSDLEVINTLKGIVVFIDRNQDRIPLPSGQDVLLPQDRLWLLRSV
jgi:Trk K+ transport system NAD-binding subunit